MQDIDQIFSDKKITQMGLGLLGRGIGDAAFLAKHGAELLVTDRKSTDELQPALAQLEMYPGIRYRLGMHNNEDFCGRDLILKGAGVPFDAAQIQAAHTAGVPVDMSASLFARIAGIAMVGVTGTRGKSTVTHLVHAMLAAAGRDVCLGGNVRGVSNLALLDTVRSDMIGVFELDSWQCQGFGEARSLDAPGVRQGPLSPSVAVFTSFMADHMNYYHGSMEDYLADKANIFLHQDSSDVLVIGRQAYEALAAYKRQIRATVVVADATDVPRSWALNLVGEHNRYNAGIAVAVARELGVDMDMMKQTVEAFAALPGRLQMVRETDGVRVYNDTNATTPDATAASLFGIDPEHQKNVVLIAGGEEKGVDASVLGGALRQTCKHVFLIPGSGSSVLAQLCQKEDVACTEVDTLASAVQQAWSVAMAGNQLLFSPGFTSHNMFQNEYDRGEQFINLVMQR